MAVGGTGSLSRIRDEIQSRWGVSFRERRKACEFRGTLHLGRLQQLPARREPASPKSLDRFSAQSHGCEQSLADPAILWQGVSVLICPDGPPRFASAHAINRTMIVASSSETELDFANHRVGISSAALVNRFIV
jgi:hypothetical protein